MKHTPICLAILSVGAGVTGAWLRSSGHMLNMGTGGFFVTCAGILATATIISAILADWDFWKNIFKHRGE